MTRGRDQFVRLMRLTILNAERWPGVTRSLLFGMRALKIELQSAPPSRPRPPLKQYRTQLLMFCACHPLSLPCSHFYVFCFPSELIVIIIMLLLLNKSFSFTLRVYFLNFQFLKNLFGLPEILDVGGQDLRGFPVQ